MSVWGTWELGRMEVGATSATRCGYIPVSSTAASLRPKGSEVAPTSILRIVRVFLSQKVLATRIPGIQKRIVDAPERATKLRPHFSPPPSSLDIEQPSITTKVSKEEKARRAEDGRGHCFPGLRRQGCRRRAYMDVFTARLGSSAPFRPTKPHYIFTPPTLFNNPLP